MMTLNINKITAALATGMLMCAVACQDVDLSTPDLTTTATSSHANFLMVNASPDAPSLDLYVNNVKTGSSISANSTQSAYANTLITSNGVLANTNIRAKATSGTIGGALGKSDLIFRAANNSANNFQAADSAYYTLIVLDSITRPKPARTVNALGIGDTTYFNLLTGKYIAGIDRAPLPAAQKNKTVAIGTVPLGSSDPGGPRFLVVTDQLPLPSATRFLKPAAGKFAVRFIHASPNTGVVTVKVGTVSLSTQGIFSYPVSFSSFNPSVGSKSTTSPTSSTALTANSYATTDIGTLTITVSQGATDVASMDYSFEDKGVYTIVLSGNRNSLPLPLTIIKNK